MTREFVAESLGEPAGGEQVGNGASEPSTPNLLALSMPFDAGADELLREVENK